MAAWRDAPYFTDAERAALLLSIALIDVWNRLNVATKQVAGNWAKSADAQAWADSRAEA